MSETPRTDAFVANRRFIDHQGPLDAWAAFARKLEMDLNEARRMISVHERWHGPVPSGIDTGPY